MQLIDYRQNTCEVYFGTYIGRDVCTNPSLNSTPNRTVVHIFTIGGSIAFETARGITWDDRDAAITYVPSNIVDGGISSTLIELIINCQNKSIPTQEIGGGDYITDIVTNPSLSDVLGISEVSSFTIMCLADVSATINGTPITLYADTEYTFSGQNNTIDITSLVFLTDGIGFQVTYVI